MPKSRLLRSLSLPKFPSISKAKAFSSGLDCIFESKVDLSNSATSKDTNGNCKSEKINGKLPAAAPLNAKPAATVAGIQKYGILSKKSCRKNKSLKWSKRFFVLKDSFLLYYDEDEAKTFEAKRKLNNHPKGVIPLGGCIIDDNVETLNKFTMLINHANFQNPVILVTNNISDQTEWLACLRDASKITLKSAQFGDVMIQELECQGLRLHKEKQNYVDRLQTEANALRDEIDKNEMLESVKRELELEKSKLERTAIELKNELNLLRDELEVTINNKKSLEEEKQTLVSQTKSLQNVLEDLEQEKQKVQQHMSLSVLENEKLSMENKDLSKVSKILQKELNRIEAKTEQLMKEKSSIEIKLQDNFQKTLVLEEEKQYYSGHAKELLASLSDLAVQKEMTESELKEEIMARLEAEKYLKSALRALEHMELALKLSGPHITEYLKDEILPDVRKLKRFFEDCADEAKLDANRPVIMRNAIYARKSFIQKCKDKMRNSLIHRKKGTATAINGKCDKILYIPITEESCNNGIDQWYSRDSFI